VVARHLLDRGLITEPSRVLLVNGAQHGLAVTLMGLLRPGDVIAADALTYPGFKVLAETLHLELVALPSSENGPDLGALERLCTSRSVRAIYTMPTLHNPLGWVMQLSERERLVSIARKHDLTIIEDAAYAYLVETAPPPVAQLAPERTVYVSGFSKSVATGLRVGFVAAPAQLIAILERAIRATTWNTPGILTAITTAWLDDGTVTRLEVEKRRDAQTRQAVAAKVLKGVRYVSHPSSYFLWLPLTEEARADQITMALMQEQISVSTAEPFATSLHVPHAIRLALGSVDIQSLKSALQRVASVVGFHS
jgi:DNA-binding transcriptional MocR family regulator